jgi:hypothetical protein
MTPGNGNEETVRREAYYLWESEGRPADRALDHWLRAEHAQASSPATEQPLDDEVGKWREPSESGATPSAAPPQGSLRERPRRP